MLTLLIISRKQVTCVMYAQFKSAQEAILTMTVSL